MTARLVIVRRIVSVLLLAHCHFFPSETMPSFLLHSLIDKRLSAKFSFGWQCNHFGTAAAYQNLLHFAVTRAWQIKCL